jgi:hypothetical protein
MLVHKNYPLVWDRHLWRAQDEDIGSLGSQTLMKSNAKMRHEGHDEALQPPHVHVGLPTGASSSQTALPPPQYNAGFAQILAALESLQGGMSSMQREVHSINLRVDQCQLDIQECLKHLHPSHED